MIYKSIECKEFRSRVMNMGCCNTLKALHPPQREGGVAYFPFKTPPKLPFWWAEAEHFSTYTHESFQSPVLSKLQKLPCLPLHFTALLLHRSDT